MRESHRETCAFCLHQLIAGISHAQVVDKTISSGTCKNILNALSATSPLNGIVVKATRDNVTGTDKGYFLSGITLVSSTVLNVSYYDDYAFMGTNGIPASTEANFKYDAETSYDTRYTTSARIFLQVS